MYEGVTEYFAGHVQVYGGMQTPQQYLNVIEEKLQGASGYKDELPFTEMSLGCLDEHQGQYGNVYQKGALIGMCLDILLRDKTSGKMGAKDLMAKLSETYGKYISFEDEKLFDKIAELSVPETREFFTNHIEGNKALPFEELFAKVGVIFKKDITIKEVSLGGVLLSFNPETQRLFVADMGSADEFGKALGYKTNDEIVSVNGVVIDMDSVEEQLVNYRKNTLPGDKVEVVVARKDKGKFINKKLKSKAVLVEKKKTFLIEFNPDATPEQLELRKAWLGQ